MKILKTYEILKMIDENPDKMLGKRYKQVGGLVREDFGIDDIAVVTKYHEITSLGAEKFSKIRIDINGFEEWEEVKESVDFMTAFGEWYLNDRNIMCILDGTKYRFSKNRDIKFYASQISRGKWYIED